MARFPVKPRLPVLQRNHPLARGLVLALPFWERGGATARGLAAKQTATLAGNTVWANTPYGPGVLLGGATADKITVPDDGRLQLQKFTVSVWVRPDVVSGNPSILRKGNSASLENYILDIAGGNYRLVVRNSGGSATTVVGSAASVGTWAHVTGTYDGTNLRIYVNGIERGANGGPGTLLTNTGSLAFGNTPDSFAGAGLTGMVAGCTIHDRALPPALIRAQTLDPWAIYQPGWWRRMNLVRAVSIPVALVSVARPSFGLLSRLAVGGSGGAYLPFAAKEAGAQSLPPVSQFLAASSGAPWGASTGNTGVYQIETETG